jgi:hypothetical protein
MAQQNYQDEQKFITTVLLNWSVLSLSQYRQGTNSRKRDGTLVAGLDLWLSPADKTTALLSACTAIRCDWHSGINGFRTFRAGTSKRTSGSRRTEETGRLPAPSATDSLSGNVVGNIMIGPLTPLIISCHLD